MSGTNVPNAIYVECPDCGEETLHEVLKGRLGMDGSTLEATLRCQECGRVHPAVVREGRTIRVPVIVSDRKESRRAEVELPEDEELQVEDELQLDDLPIIISSLEREGARVSRALAKDVTAIWAKRFDKVHVRVSINDVHKTIPAEVDALPEEEFFVGDLMTIGRYDVVITQIKTRDAMARRGAVMARDIVRIYAKRARTTCS
ncbi:MAG TPA: HVO_0476 family zinc finger protein [Methanomassiliicoccales archaeon]|mgnify:FL=1|nr:HVO_0476 family zinc finger protein [Methanomassiliicoccales archaeon]HQM67064.1 HVO_0476 family zinc finger protein [Methanomassiliicoccales archaeon]